MKIDCDVILKNLYFDDKNFAYNYRKGIILQELQNIFGHIYIGGQKTLITDHLFIGGNVRVNEQMNASEFERLLYIILSEKTSKDEKVHIGNYYNEVRTWLIS